MMGRGREGALWKGPACVTTSFIDADDDHAGGATPLQPCLAKNAVLSALSCWLAWEAEHLRPVGPCFAIH